MPQLTSALGPLLGRLLLSGIFFHAGFQKLVSPGRVAASLVGRGLPFATGAVYAAGAFEIAAAVLVTLGLKTRLVAVVLVLYLALVSWLYHWHPALRGDQGQLLHLLKNAGLAGGMLLLASFGPGSASIDRG